MFHLSNDECAWNMQSTIRHVQMACRKTGECIRCGNRLRACEKYLEYIIFGNCTNTGHGGAVYPRTPKNSFSCSVNSATWTMQRTPTSEKLNNLNKYISDLVSRHAIPGITSFHEKQFFFWELKFYVNTMKNFQLPLLMRWLGARAKVARTFWERGSVRKPRVRLLSISPSIYHSLLYKLRQ